MPKLKLIDSNGRAYLVKYDGYANFNREVVEDFDITFAQYENGEEVPELELASVLENNEDAIFQALFEIQMEEGESLEPYERNDSENGY